MAKIIFRSNTVNNGYTIGYDSIEAPDNSSVKSGGIKKTAKIKVSPRSGSQLVVKRCFHLTR